MKLLIDDANIAAIRELYEFYPIDGVTTNPSILAKTGRPPFAVLREIRSFIGPEASLHVQATAPEAAGMVEELPSIPVPALALLFVAAVVATAVSIPLSIKLYQVN